MQFQARLASDPGDWLLVFAGAGGRMIAVWTVGAPHEVVVAGQTVMLTSRPEYLAG